MLSNAYFLAKFRFDTAENEPAKKLQNFRKMHFRKKQRGGRLPLLGDGVREPVGDVDGGAVRERRPDAAQPEHEDVLERRPHLGN